MRAALFLIPLALSSAACSSGEEFARQSGVAEATATASGRAAAAAPVKIEDNSQQDGAQRTFTYAWPAEASAIPELMAQLTAEREQARTEQKADFAQARHSEPIDCIPCRTRGYRKEWKVVADTPGYLSLSAWTDTYTGGAHGNYGLQSLVWDKAAKRALDGAALFRSPSALDGALGGRLCAALNAQREEKRGEPVQPVVEGDTGFSACQSSAEATVLVGSSTGRAFNRIGIWFGPYVAGPYAEGAYELDFPVDAAVLRAVKPEYAKAFAATR